MRLRPYLLLSFVLAACGGDARITAPEGAGAFERFVTLGTGFTMGEMSGGVVYESQITAWPSRLAARMGASFTVPAFRQPGCTPPLVAPLSLRRTLEGVIGTTVSCAGALGTETLPGNNLAISGATAWDALHTSPRSFAGLTPTLNQARYGLVLPPTQTQVQAMRSRNATLIAVELGAGEVIRAATSGLVTVGTGYTQKAAWTLMPASVFAPVLDSIADSVVVTGARAVFIGVPAMTSLPAWRHGDELWQQRADLAANGIALNANCQGNANLLNTVALLPAMAAAARSSGTAQPLSCADQPGVVDYVLTPADVQVIDQAITAINAAIKAAADKRGFAYTDTPLLSRQIPFAAPAFVPSTMLGADQPFGMATSLDGFFFSAYGHDLMADAVAAALNAKYGWGIPIPPRPL